MCEEMGILYLKGLDCSIILNWLESKKYLITDFFEALREVLSSL